MIDFLKSELKSLNLDHDTKYRGSVVKSEGLRDFLVITLFEIVVELSKD